MHERLEVEVLAGREVARDLLAVAPRRHDRLPDERRVGVQEGKRALVLVEDVVLELGIAGEELADEAAPPDASVDVSRVDSPALRHRRPG